MEKQESQNESAQRMYDARAALYEDSWHPQYSRRFVELLDLRPGQRILDLCCGTGLEAFLAAELVGDDGEIIGVDISRGMLAQAQERQKRELPLGRRIRFLRHDVTDLASLPEVTEKSFDIIICSNAFVFLQKPAEAVAVWRRYLKAEGILAVDIPHEHNMRSGVVMGRVADRLGIQIPWNRTWTVSKDSFSRILEQEGFTVIRVEELTDVTGLGRQHHTLDEADEQFDKILKGGLSNYQGDAYFEKTARPVFREEFAKDAIDGKVKVVDSLYVYIAKKA